MFYLYLFIGATIFWTIQQRMGDHRRFRRFRWTTPEAEAQARAYAFSHPAATVFEGFWRGAWTTVIVYLASGMITWMAS